MAKKYLFENMEVGKVYDTVTCYRCLKLEEFLEKVEKDNVIVGMEVDKNNICFIVDSKKEEPEDKQATRNYEVGCENCDQKPTVGDTGLCGPCCFGEAETINGNW